MADPTDYALPADAALTNGDAPPATPTADRPPNRFPTRPRLKVDAEAVVESVTRRLQAILDARTTSATNEYGWVEARLRRYAKYRGWLEEKTYPWPHAANTHPPVLQMAELRTNAGLTNTLTTMRPLLSAKATQPANQPKEEKITQTIDTQIFVDPGPEHAGRVVRNYVTSALQDGNAVIYTPWVREVETITTVEYQPAQPAADPESVLFDFIAKRWPNGADLLDSDAHEYEFRVTRPDGTTGDLTVKAYQDDEGAFQFELTRDETLFDGPLLQDLPVETLLIPPGCENLQPARAWNPTGAPYVGVAWSYRLNELRRLRETGELNYLDDEALAKIVASLRTVDPQGKELAEQKAAGAGVDTPMLETTLDTGFTEDEGHLPVDTWLVFDQWDLDGDGSAEDVIWRVAKDAMVLLSARTLREEYPAVRAFRPFGETCPIPVPGQWHGISMLELGEALYDLIKGSLDQALDGNSLASLQFFFYNSTSKMATDLNRVEPGAGIPFPGDPRASIYFPQMSGRDQQFAVQAIGLASQWFDRLMSIGGLQQGQVPTGKASALRTVGTTQALLQQGDVRADQLLIALFDGLRQCAAHIHAMNRHRLPPKKVIRRAGWTGEREAAYLTITPDDIDAECDFEFRPDFLLASKEMRMLAIEKFLMIVGTPFAMQAGILKPKQLFEIVKDYARAGNLDARRYIHEPPDVSDPPILWEEALSEILQTRKPVGPPLEGAEAQFEKAAKFIMSDELALLSPVQTKMLTDYQRGLMQAIREAQMAQSAATLQQSLQAGAPQGQGMDTTAQEPAMAMGPAVSPEGTGVGA